jgi:hypothetical protein
MVAPKVSAPQAQDAAATQQSQKAPPFTISATRRQERWLNVLIYGDYGVGKTYLAATSQDVPAMQNTLIIDAEAGDLSVSDRSDLDSIRVTAFSTLARVYEYLRLHVRARDEGDTDTLQRLEQRYRGANPDATPRLYRTVVIDSLTEVQKFAMYSVLGSEIGPSKLDADPDSPQFADWGKQLELIRRLVRSFRDLPMHFICVCPERVTEDDRKRQVRRPSMTGQVEREVPGFFDVVGYMQAGPGPEGQGTVRRLHLAPGQTFLAKTRFQVTQPYIDNPTMAEIYRLCMRQG